MNGVYLYTLTEIRFDTPTVARLTLTPSGHGRLQHLPGQYVAIAFNQADKISQARSFSLASAPNPAGVLEISLRVQGPFTQAVSSLPAGTPITVYGPFGSLFVRAKDQTPLVMVAGGIGITPFMSIIRAATTENWQSKLVLLYSNRTQADTPYWSELQELARQNPHLHAHYWLSQDTAVAPVQAGRITAAAIQTATGQQPAAWRYIVCGPPAFNDAMVGMIQALGVPNTQIGLESFMLGPSAQLKKSTALATSVYGLSAISLIAIASLLAGQYNRQQAAATAAATLPVTTTTVVVPTPTPASSTATTVTPAPVAPTTYATPTPTAPARVITPRTTLS